MTPTAFDRLPRTEEGLPVVTLMSDPDTGEDAFLSVVDKGANGRRIVVAKVDAGPLDTQVESEAHLGSGGSGMAWLRTLFAPLFGSGPEQVTAGKADTDEGQAAFEAAVAIPEVFQRIDKGWSALYDAIWSVMGNDEIRDKRAAVELAVAQFGRYVAAAFDDLPTLTSKQASEVAGVVRGLPRSDRGSHAGAREATILAARGHLRAAKAALEALEGTPSGDNPRSTEPGDTMLNADQIATLAQKAAEAATAAARKANPAATEADLIQAGERARLEVMKAAVSGPAQPAMPQTAVREQIAQTDTSGRATDPLATFEAAIAGMTMLTKKIAGALGLDPETGAEVALAEDGKNAGLVHVVTKQGEALAALAKRVQKIDGTPAPSAQGGDDPAATPTKETARKGADFKGTALDLGGLQ